MPPSKPSRNRRNRSTFILIASHLLTTTRKGIEKTVKWMATDHMSTTEYGAITGTLQSLKHLNARQALTFRKYDRLISRCYLMPSRFQMFRDWLVDNLLFLRDILWGFFKPILENIFFGVLRIIAIVLVNFIFYYALFKLITL